MVQNTNVAVNVVRLLQILQNLQRDGLLHAYLPERSTGIHSGQIYATFRNGQINTCYVINGQRKIVLSGDSALQLAYNIGTLNWVIEETPSQIDRTTNPYVPAIRPTTAEMQKLDSSTIRTINTTPLPGVRVPRTSEVSAMDRTFTQPQSLAQLYHNVPQRLMQLDAPALHNLPRQHRRVFMLIDGVRTIAQIATLLFPSSNGIHETLAILHDLKSQRLVRIGD